MTFCLRFFLAGAWAPSLWFSSQACLYPTPAQPLHPWPHARRPWLHQAESTGGLHGTTTGPWGCKLWPLQSDCASTPWTRPSPTMLAQVSSSLSLGGDPRPRQLQFPGNFLPLRLHCVGSVSRCGMERPYYTKNHRLRSFWRGWKTADNIYIRLHGGAEPLQGQICSAIEDCRFELPLSYSQHREHEALRKGRFQRLLHVPTAQQEGGLEVKGCVCKLQQSKSGYHQPCILAIPQDKKNSVCNDFGSYGNRN